MLTATRVDPKFVLVERTTHWPRFWSTVWSLSLNASQLATRTQKLFLWHLDALYAFADTEFGQDSLDTAIGTRNVLLLQSIVERFYIALTDGDYNTTAVQRWDVVRKFLRSATLHLNGYREWRALRVAIAAYGRLRRPKRGRFKFPRALPDITLVDLLHVAEPDSPRNPFRRLDIQWRCWLIVHLMLFAGLRRGEVLLLLVDSLKHDVDPSGEVVYWLNVTTTEEEDLRASKPSIKTDSSHRQVPVSSSLANLYEGYANYHRVPSDRHGFLVTSRDGNPLSAESVESMFRQLSGRLTSTAKERFTSKTGGKDDVSGHDLRHTCATARYAMFMKLKSDLELTLQRMRAFFGWSPTSDMPHLYAHAAINDDMVRSWNAVNDQHVSTLREGKAA